MSTNIFRTRLSVSEADLLLYEICCKLESRGHLHFDQENHPRKPWKSKETEEKRLLSSAFILLCYRAGVDTHSHSFAMLPGAATSCRLRPASAGSSAWCSHRTCSCRCSCHSCRSRSGSTCSAPWHWHHLGALPAGGPQTCTARRESQSRPWKSRLHSRKVQLQSIVLHASLFANLHMHVTLFFFISSFVTLDLFSYTFLCSYTPLK